MTAWLIQESVNEIKNENEMCPANKVEVKIKIYTLYDLFVPCMVLGNLANG